MSLSVDIIKSFGSFALDVAFEIGNETLGFLGQSGCGKSLTLRCIAGVETPDAGKIVVHGKTFFDKASTKKAAQINLSPQERKTALLFQNYQLFPNLTVADNIAAGMDPALSKEEKQRLVATQLRHFDLIGKGKRYPRQLSGGQQQRVALARMLSAKPDILMLDEPFSALDAHMKSGLEQNLLGLFEEFQGSILYVSHDIDEAFRFCDRIAVVENGSIVEMGPKRDIVKRPSSLAAIRLSGCKNTTPATKVDNHTVELPVWGIRLHCSQEVPGEITHIGIRAFMIERAAEPGENVFRVRADRISDARFDRTAMLEFLDTPYRALPKNVKGEVDSSFLDLHLQWRINSLGVEEDALPYRGEELLIRIPPEKIYMATR